MTREELESGRYRRNPNRVYGYFFSYCEQTSCCEDCDKWIRLGCKLQRKIEDLQTKRILKICK